MTRATITINPTQYRMLAWLIRELYDPKPTSPSPTMAVRMVRDLLDVTVSVSVIKGCAGWRTDIPELNLKSHHIDLGRAVANLLHLFVGTAVLDSRKTKPI